MATGKYKGEPLHIPGEPGLVDEDGKTIEMPDPQPISAETDGKLAKSADPGSPIPLAPSGEKVASAAPGEEMIPVATVDNPNPEPVEVDET